MKNAKSLGTKNKNLRDVNAREMQASDKLRRDLTEMRQISMVNEERYERWIREMDILCMRNIEKLNKSQLRDANNGSVMDRIASISLSPATIQARARLNASQIME